MESIFLQTDEERYHYEMREKALHDYVSTIFSAKQDGIQEGLERGKQEEKRETARNLLALNVPLETIMKATGLTEEELKQLRL